VGRTVQLKVKWSDFTQITRQRALPAPTDAPEVIAEAALDLLSTEIGPLLAEGKAIRLLGVGLHGIIAPDGRRAAEGLIQLPLPLPDVEDVARAS
jgi:DNA polymerase-4